MSYRKEAMMTTVFPRLGQIERTPRNHQALAEFYADLLEVETAESDPGDPPSLPKGLPTSTPRFLARASTRSARLRLPAAATSNR